MISRSTSGAGVAKAQIARSAATRIFETPMPVKRIQLGGTFVDLCDRAVALDLIRSRFHTHATSPLFIASANLDHIHHFSRRHRGKDLFLETSLTGDGAQWLVLLDGMPLVWAASLMTVWPWDQIAGSDLLPEALSLAASMKVRVGFLGGQSEMHKRLRFVLSQRYPRLDVGGMWAPSRSELDDPARSAALASQVRKAGIDLLVVGLGKPRQEEWLARHGLAAGIRVGLAFGAAADFLAGTAQRAPRGFQRAGLEWFYRLVHEPKRLSRRYLIEGPPALYHLARESSVHPR